MASNNNSIRPPTSEVEQNSRNYKKIIFAIVKYFLIMVVAIGVPITIHICIIPIPEWVWGVISIILILFTAMLLYAVFVHLREYRKDKNLEREIIKAELEERRKREELKRQQSQQEFDEYLIQEIEDRKAIRERERLELNDNIERQRKMDSADIEYKIKTLELINRVPPKDLSETINHLVVYEKKYEILEETKEQ